MFKYIIIVFFALFYSGCGKVVKENPPYLINENTLKEFAANAINGDRNYNDTLSGLIDYSLPINSDFNDLRIEKIHTPENRTLFTLLIEFPNPVYNRFAVYDSSLNLLLLDKSLNGRLSMKTLISNNLFFIETDESFISKDILQLDRISLYKADSTVSLQFRMFTRLKTPSAEYSQKISEISPDRIRTDLSGNKRSLISNKSEIFTFDNSLKKYVSKDQVFYNFIKDQISSVKRTAEKPEITDEKSLLQSVGVTKDADTIKTTSNVSSKGGYSLTIDVGWKEIRDISLAGFPDKLRGTRYYNPSLGANIFVSRIPVNDSAEVFVKTGLKYVKQGNYRVRYSDKVEQGKSFIQYFEFTCGTNKYIMIFESSKYTYDKYKSIYENIINSFAMDC
jgi:hypothetical protein